MWLTIAVGFGYRKVHMDDMATPVLSIWEAFVYGLIQGVTEFLPVSSSGHLALAHQFGLGNLPKESELPFDVMLHASTLIAIAVAFRKEILAALTWRPKFYVCVLISIVPAGIFGLVGKRFVEAAGDSWWVLGACYVFTAVLLTVAERISMKRVAVEAEAKPVHESLDQVSYKQAMIVGGVHVLALFPGVSRSGSTIAGGLLGGMRPAMAVSYSFLVGLPLIVAAAGKDALGGGWGMLVEQVGLVPLLVAFSTALVAGLGSIVALKLVVGKRRLVWFGAYCGLVGLVCIWQALSQ
ncbi:MAG: undecaprenyl-diphosphate phosphatase [Polyangiaceae bacterium]|nr:undecaprenyl-diphosphate phosphatase [Polyangiaceae bacterium]